MLFHTPYKRPLPRCRRPLMGEWVVMPKGQPVPDDIVLIFAEEYLKTGSPRASAKVAGIAERTGYDIAYRLDDDPDFCRRRKRIRDVALDRAEAAVMRSIEVLSDRMENAQEILGGKDGNMMVVDKSADYGRSIASLTDTLIKRSKLEFEKTVDKPQSGPVEIVITTGASPAQVTVSEPNKSPEA